MDCEHIWFVKGCIHCERRGPVPHEALTDYHGVCYICGEVHADETEENLGWFGTFEHEGEAFCWGPDDAILGYTVVIDSHDQPVAVAHTPSLAVEKARYELDCLRDIVDGLLDDLFPKEER